MDTSNAAAYLVIYEGAPADREAFLDYYVNQHLPIIWTWPGVQSVEIALGVESDDSLANPAHVFMIARFAFRSVDDLRNALQSEERLLARQDSANFPVFTGRVRHQAVEIVHVSR